MSSPTLPPLSAALFDRWVAQRRQQGVLRLDTSVAIYRSMWQAFSQWCEGQGLRLDRIDGPVIDRFLRDRAATEGLTDRHAWRWLSLLDAVLRQGLPAAAVAALAPAGHSASPARTTGEGPMIRGLAPNRAAAELLESRPQWRYANASDRDPLPDHLDAAQARRLVEWLTRHSRSHEAPGARAGSWQALRNRASVALQLGAGLAPGDVRAALVKGVRTLPAAGRPSGDRIHSLRIPRHGAVAERDVPVAPWAARLLREWLDRRATEALPGEMLFPGMRRGSPWSKVSQFEAAAELLQAAGVAEAGRGSFVLRHTFALRQLRRGHAAEDVARWLGVTDPAVMARYQRVVYDPVELDDEHGGGEPPP